MLYMELHTYLFENDKTLLAGYNPVDITLPSGITGSVDYKFYYQNEPVRLYMDGFDETVYALRVTDETGSVSELVKLSDGVYSFAMPASRATVAVVARRPGDVNGDGVVDIRDLVRAKKIMAEGSGDTAADLDGNGTFDSRDLTQLRKILMGVVSGGFSEKTSAGGADYPRGCSARLEIAAPLPSAQEHFSAY